MSACIFYASTYHMHIKFHGLIFRVFDWQENSWGINFCGHGSMVVVLWINFRGLEAYHEIHKNLYTSKISTHTV